MAKIDALFNIMLENGASDMHLCTGSKPKLRQHGELQEMAPLPFKYRAAIVSRIKIMSELDISERRLPQDGRIKIRVKGRDVDHPPFAIGAAPHAGHLDKTGEPDAQQPALPF